MKLKFYASSTAEKVASVYIDRIPKDDPEYFIKCCKYYDALWDLANNAASVLPRYREFMKSKIAV